jgi:secondary thiamine-phosphate synthase enzyme
MPIHTFTVKTQRRTQMVDITAEVAKFVATHAPPEGICSVYVPHATAAITINENADPQVCEDILEALGKVAPQGVWRHDRVDGNADAHIKASLIGSGQSIPVRGGKLLLGTWQAIMLVELDGPRTRTVHLTLR